MKKTNLELILDYLDKHKWQGRIIAVGIALAMQGDQIKIIIDYFV